jgi:hypothetical protein
MSLWCVPPFLSLLFVSDDCPLLGWRVSDVGGGSVANGTPSTLARIPLRWMIRECFKTKTGIMFHTDGLREIGLDPARLYPAVLPRPPALPVGSAKICRMPSDAEAAAAVAAATAAASAAAAGAQGVAGGPEGPMVEEVFELKDALSPVYDQLALAPAWWILEVLVMKYRYQKKDNTWSHTWG